MDLYFAVPGVAISQKTPEKPAGERSPSGAIPTRAPFPFESSVPRCTTSAVDGNQISYQFSYQLPYNRMVAGLATFPPC